MHEAPMTALCGWMSTRFDEVSAIAAREAVIEASGGSGSARPSMSAASAGTIIAIEGTIPVRVERRGACLVGILGQVTWKDTELVRIAESSGATAAVARAYEMHGTDCVKHMHGPFALALFDDARKCGVVAIDRMAVRNMYYARAAGGLVFGTRARAVTVHADVGRHLSPQGIFNYLYSENVPGPGTIYEGVTKLLPGQRVVIDGASVHTDYYWQLDYGTDTGKSEAALGEEFRRLLQESVARAATTNSVGAFLSGGTDSSTVAGMLTQLRGHGVDTYSIGFDAEGFDEMEYARVASRHFHTRAHEYYVTPRDVVDTIPLIAAAYDEPFGNASAVPTYHCAKLARQDGKTLLLAGDGGDEIFGGNARYAKQKVFEWYGLLPVAVRRALVEPLLFSGAWIEHVPPLRKARSYVQQARIPLPDRLETYNFLEREALTAIFEPDFLKAIDPHQPTAIAREDYFRTNSYSPVNRMLHLDLKETLADNDLPKVNRMCALAGIEVRYPLLDDELVAFSGRLSPEQKVKGLKLRHFFKTALADFLPRETLTKSKHGFGLPFGLWMEQDAALRDLAQSSLASFRQRGYVKADYIDHLLRQHQTVHASYFGVMIWIIMMLETWLQHHDY
jgi:asparagine synthase (glutamine-hydrolysing)